MNWKWPDWAFCACLAYLAFVVGYFVGREVQRERNAPVRADAINCAVERMNCYRAYMMDCR